MDRPLPGLAHAVPCPAAGVLGSRPPFQPQQAMMAQQAFLAPSYQFPSPAYASTPTDSQNTGALTWDMSVLYTALNSAGVATAPPSSNDWYLDTGASAHMTSNAGNLTHSHPLQLPNFITVSNGAQLPVSHTGSTPIPTSSHPLYLRNVLISPSLIKNLISMKQLTRDNNVSIEFDPSGFSIKDLRTQTVKLRCDSSGNLYPLRLRPHQTFTAATPSSVELWHSRLGHPGSHVLQQVLHSFAFQCNKSAPHSCNSCRLGKSTRLPFQNSTTSTYFPFQVLHSDVWTSPICRNSGYKYYLVLLDDFTHYVWTFPMRQKSEVLPILHTFFAYVRTQFGLPVLALQTDNGKEFDSVAVRQLLGSLGTTFRLSYPYTS